MQLIALLKSVEDGYVPDDGEVRCLAANADLPALMTVARTIRDRGHHNVISYSRKVFIPLTRLCRDVCGYCVFAATPEQTPRPYLRQDEVIDVARQGVAAGCKEVLFTLGDKPELRYPAARKMLAELGHDSTISYLRRRRRMFSNKPACFHT